MVYCFSSESSQTINQTALQQILKQVTYQGSPGFCLKVPIVITYYVDSLIICHDYQIRSVAQSCPTLCNPMNRSMPGLTVQHQLPEFTETHVHRVSDAIQPSIESVMPSSYLIVCRPLVHLSPIPPSKVRVSFQYTISYLKWKNFFLLWRKLHHIDENTQ